MNKYNYFSVITSCYSLVGHGLSEGERGLVDSMESFVTDVVNHIKDTKKEFKDTPLFLFGHSNVG